MTYIIIARCLDFDARSGYTSPASLLRVTGKPGVMFRVKPPPQNTVRPRFELSGKTVIATSLGPVLTPYNHALVSNGDREADNQFTVYQIVAILSVICVTIVTYGNSENGRRAYLVAVDVDTTMCPLL